MWAVVGEAEAPEVWRAAVVMVVAEVAEMAAAEAAAMMVGVEREVAAKVEVDTEEVRAEKVGMGGKV